LNIVWIPVIPSRELTLKFTEKVIYSETLIVSLCNGVTLYDGMVWTGLIQLRIGTSGGLL
jgi:hypothetical protein